MGRSLSNLKKDELVTLAEGTEGVEVTEDDTRESLIEKLEGAGVTEAPSEADAEEKDQQVGDVQGRYPGGTPDGASESQQPPSKQNLAGTSDPVLPDLDEPTRLAVTPRPAVAPNPASQYDDSRRGQPVDDDEEASRRKARRPGGPGLRRGRCR